MDDAEASMRNHIAEVFDQSESPVVANLSLCEAQIMEVFNGR